MLNIGMSELLVFAIIALLVLGPEKLPEGARFAGKWYGKAKSFVSKVQTELDHELKLSAFRAEMQQEIDRLTELEVRMHQQLEFLKKSHLKDTTKETQALNLANLSYQSFNGSVFPYSISYATSNLPEILKTQSATQTQSTLKIAV